MSAIARPSHSTHDVLNQSTPLEDYNAFLADRPLREAMHREGGGWADEQAIAIGALAGGAEAIRWGFEANEHEPVLRTHDRFGHRIDEVEFHPAWHELMATAIGHGLHATPWTDPQPGAHVARAAKYMTWTQVEAGHACPVTMTFAAVPALRAQPDLAAELEPKLTSTVYEPGLHAPAAQKAGALCGMGMTEKQGGSDVRANTTRAERISDGEYLITGHKWFTSAPMCDVFLVLAQAEGGLSCFLVPRILPDGERNVFRIQRLKSKLGNRSNASSEPEFDGTWARLVGEEGRGVPTIIEMVAHTRLDCAIGAAAGMRQGVAQGIHHASQRMAFGKLLIDQPLMLAVLADLAIESEAATVAAMRLARAYDEAQAGDEEAAAFKRLATAVVKYWSCKRAPVHAAEAIEVFGGNGYVEDSGMPRLYREAPLNGIWEGSGNVMCLDVLRAMMREPLALEGFLGEVAEAAGADARLDAAAERLRAELADMEGMEARARTVVEHMALCLEGSLLVRHGDPAVADAFCATRLGGQGGRAFGTLPRGVDARAIVQRHAPVAA
jgi:putative acyl-CoA dehydrogenase